VAGNTGVFWTADSVTIMCEKCRNNVAFFVIVNTDKNNKTWLCKACYAQSILYNKFGILI